MEGKFVVITGPSAAGKSLLVDTLLTQIPNSARLITVTTRAPRPHEREGIDYFFVSREEFQKRLAEEEFFEHAEVYGNLYGSSKEVLRSFLDRHTFVFAIIDVQGARTLKERIPDSLVLFVRPGSIEEISRRLKAERMGVPEEEINKRIETAIQELHMASDFDKIIENREGSFEKTLTDTMFAIGLK